MKKNKIITFEGREIYRSRHKLLQCIVLILMLLWLFLFLYVLFTTSLFIISLVYDIFNN